jgi:dephospho-CoA kinase
MSLPQIIGIAGTISSGKDTLAEYLVENYGFHHVSTGDMVRAEATKRYGDIERSTLQIVGPELRAEGGAGVLVTKALESPRPVVITGLRAIGEIKTLKAAGGVLLFIDAYVETRYERMLKRDRDIKSERTFEGFARSERAEVAAGEKDEDFNQIVIQNMADKTINNSGNLETLYKVAIDFLEKFQQARN